jgi:hypothetical protein
VALGELGRQPLHLFWVRQLVRFWNRLQASMGEPDRLLGWAMADNLALMREGADLATGSPCWCRRWLQFLQSAPTDSGTLVWLTQLDEGAVVERAAAAHLLRSLEPAKPKSPQSQTPCPRPAEDPPPQTRQQQPAASSQQQQQLPAASSQQQQPATANKFAYYLENIRSDLPLTLPAPHLSQVANTKHRISYSRFRTSCHDLRIERERYLPEAIRAPRHERNCLVCASPAIEDEIHMVFHCPIYDHLRFEYADLFPIDMPQTLSSFLSQDQKRVAAFIHDCLTLRRSNACMSLAGSESAL